jgi:very-short-patch-repair endonuclease
MSGEFAVSDHSGSELRTDADIAALAGRQHGVVSRRQLATLGLTKRMIDRRLGIGRFHILHRGVFAVGHTVVSREGRWMAAVLAGGDGAVLSHQSAAALWGFRPTSRERIDVTAPRRLHARDGLQMDYARLEPDETTLLDAIPVTTPARTLADLKHVLTKRQLDRAVNEAERLRLDVGDARAPATPRTRSELEERFLALLDARKMPRPEMNVTLEGIEVDALWRDRRLVVELDGFETHGTREAFETDRSRDRRLTAAGYRTVRLTWRQLDAGVEDLRGLGV